MGWDWTNQDLRPIALIRVKYKDRNGETAHARWAGPEGRAGSGLMWEDPDGLVAGVHSWEARTVGGMALEESLGPIDKAELAVGGLTFQIRAPSAPAESDNATEKAAVSKFRDDLNLGRWERAEVIVWLLDRSTETAVEFFRGRARKGWTVMDDERLTMPVEALPFSLADLRLPHTRLPGSATEWTNTITPPGAVSFRNPANFVLHPRYQGKTMGPVIGDFTGDESFGWVEVVPFGTFNFAGSIVGFFLHVSPLLKCFVRDVAFEGNDGTVTLLSDLNSQSNDYIRTYEATDPTAGPVGTNCVAKIPSSESPSLQWLNEGRRFWVRAYGYRAGTDDPSDPPYYVGDVGGSGEVAPDPPDLWRARIDDVVEDTLEGSEWTDLSDVYGTGAIADFWAGRQVFGPSFENVSSILGHEPLPEPIATRDWMAGLALGLGFDFCPRFDPVSGEIRIFPLWRTPGPYTVTADWTLSGVDLRRQSPPRSIKCVRDPDGVYANRITVKSSSRILPPLDTLDAAAQGSGETAIVRVEATEQAAVGDVVERTVTTALYNPKPDGNTPSNGFRTISTRIARDLAQPQLVMVAGGGFPLARIQLGDTVRYGIDGYTDKIGQVRSRRIDVGTGEVTLRSHHIVFFNLGTQQEGGSD